MDCAVAIRSDILEEASMRLMTLTMQCTMMISWLLHYY